MRVLRHAAIAGSALVCVAAVADRVWDHWQSQYFSAMNERASHGWTVYRGPWLQSGMGVLVIGVRSYEGSSNHRLPYVEGVHYKMLNIPGEWWRCGDSFLNHFGFALHLSPEDYYDGDFHQRAWFIEVPKWFTATLAAIAPGVWLTGRLRRRRDRDADRCRRCGYDLRATPDRCPECGESRAIA